MSDDCASEDYLDVNDLYQEVYLRGNLMEAELHEAKKAEELYSASLKKEIQSASASRRKIPIEKPLEQEYLESDDDSFKSNTAAAIQESHNNNNCEGSLSNIVNKINNLSLGSEPL